MRCRSCCITLVTGLVELFELGCCSTWVICYSQSVVYMDCFGFLMPSARLASGCAGMRYQGCSAARQRFSLAVGLQLDCIVVHALSCFVVLVVGDCFMSFALGINPVATGPVSSACRPAGFMFLFVCMLLGLELRASVIACVQYPVSGYSN